MNSRNGRMTEYETCGERRNYMMNICSAIRHKNSSIVWGGERQHYDG